MFFLPTLSKLFSEVLGRKEFGPTFLEPIYISYSNDNGLTPYIIIFPVYNFGSSIVVFQWVVKISNVTFAHNFKISYFDSKLPIQPNKYVLDNVETDANVFKW